MKPRLLVVLVALGLALPALGDYRQSYLDGIKALRKGAWEEAVRLLSAAIAERPTEQVRARLVGVIPEPYLPHAYLGLAYAGQGRCPAALAEWKLSAAQGAVAAGSSLAQELAAGRARCEAAEPKGEPATTPPSPAPTVDAPASSVEPKRSDAAPAPTELSGELPAASATAPATAGPPTATAAPLNPALVAAVQAYFDGNYALALNRLSGLVPAASSRERFYRPFFRAASRHALYLLDGERDAALLAAAVADLRAARQEDPAFAPHPDAFSPRFVDFFRDHPP